MRGESMPIIQKNLPIVFILQGGELFAEKIPIPILFGTGIGLVTPENWQLLRPSRGTITHTATAAFLDDFGPGVPMLLMSGTTGWSEPKEFGGIVGLQALEVMFQEYLNRRKRMAEAGLDPDLVHLLYLDALHVQALLVYPHEFQIDRTKNSPLLYFYHMRLSALRDLKYEALFGVAQTPLLHATELLQSAQSEFRRMTV